MFSKIWEFTKIELSMTISIYLDIGCELHTDAGMYTVVMPPIRMVVSDIIPVANTK